MNFDPTQLAAIHAAATGASDCIITGGAGTGKTTIIKAVADRLGGQVEIMCPTGKAAAQVRDRTGYNAYTIHRAMLWDGERFHRKGKITVPAIIDESSMVDSWLMATLTEWCCSRIILVGDAAQLPPVGPGAPFHDLIDLRPDIVHRLTKCHRASGAVHKAAQAIRAGAAPAKCEQSGGETWQMIQTGDAAATIHRIESWVSSGKYDATKDLILAPVYGDGEKDGGIDAINAAVRAIVNPSADKWSINDRVLNCKNFADLDFWNGDIGTITSIDVDGNLWVALDRDPTNQVLCRTEQKRELRHGYCVSVHKAQGSQARRVFFVCLRQHRHMLNRALIYTACTRAQEACVVCGEMAAFYEGLNKERRKATAMQIMAAQDGEL